MKASADTTLLSTSDYRQFIADLKARVTAARLSAAWTVNRDLILLYWDIGRGIVEKQKALGRGEAVIDRISRDLQAAFPDTTGFSPRNLRSVKQFCLAYSDSAIWLQAAAKLNRAVQGADIWLQPVAKLTGEKVIEFLRQFVAEIPWGHNLLILNKLTDPAARISNDTLLAVDL